MIYSCFLDLSKAFERVRHSFLLRKLLDAKVPFFVVNLLRSMFLKSKITVNFNGKSSFEWLALRGLRQGGILSAFLFTFYIDEILREVSSMPYHCKLGINKINIQAYADDIVVLCPTPSGLQEILKKLHDLLGRHELLINIAKTKTVIFKMLGPPLKIGRVSRSVTLLLNRN